jgi:hypothetical protein
MERNLTRRTNELGTPDSWILGKVEWDAFCTFTWAVVPPPTVQEKCIAELTRRIAKQIYKVSSTNDFVWGFRYEEGESTGRPHWHALIGAYQNRSTNKHIIAHQISHIWENEVKSTKSKKYRPCVGHAKVRAYDSSKAGAEYICKPALSARDFYELQKFHDGFKSYGSEASRVSLGPRLILEIAKNKNKTHKVPGFARFLRTWKQRNLASKRGSSKSSRNYHVRPSSEWYKHPADDDTTRAYC